MKKKLLIVLSFVSLGFGILGMFIPILPTTPFLLLSATLFAKSSDYYYIWLLTHKYFGPYIKDFRENKSIPLRIKIFSISLLWLTILISIIFAAKGMLWLQIMLAAIAVGVSIHILSFKTKR